MIRHRYCVIGYGNIGRFIGFILRDHDPLIVSRHLKNGVVNYVFKRDDVGENVSLSAAGLDSSFSCDNAFLAVKAYDIPIVAEALSGRVERVFSLQNGLGVYEYLTSVFDGDRVYGMPLTYGVKSCGDDCSELVGDGVFYLGSNKNGYSNVIIEVKKLFEDEGFRVIVVEDVVPYIWLKALVNIGINALTAITRRPNRIILEDKGIMELAVDAVREGARVAELLGIVLPEDPVRVLLEVADKTGSNVSSMLHDVLSGRRTEIDFLNGYIYKRGMELGVEVPVNKVLYFLVKALEKRE